MNKAEISIKVAAKSGVSQADCEKVLDALEDVLGDELSDSGGLGGAFDKIYRLMDFFKKRKEPN